MLVNKTQLTGCWKTTTKMFVCPNSYTADFCKVPADVKPAETRAEVSNSWAANLNKKFIMSTF